MDWDSRMLIGEVETSWKPVPNSTFASLTLTSWHGRAAAAHTWPTDPLWEGRQNHTRAV